MDFCIICYNSFMNKNAGINANKLTVAVKKLDERAVLPAYGSAAAAGADLCACMEQAVNILPGQTVFIGTGLAVELPEGYAGLIYARSGLAAKKGLAPANKVGVIDSDYRGEIIIALHNHSAENALIEPGERVAQLVITPYFTAVFQETDELNSSIRGGGGFGSTGRK